MTAATEAGASSGLAAEALALVDRGNRLYHDLRAEYHMAGVLYQAEIAALGTRIAELEADLAESEHQCGLLERDANDWKAVVRRLQNWVDRLQGRSNQSVDLGARVNLVALLGEHTVLAAAPGGVLTGACPLCSSGVVHTWLDLHTWWCAGCGRHGGVSELLEALDEAGL